MNTDLARTVLAYLVVIVVLGMGFYSLILSPFVLDDLVKGAWIGFMGSAITWVFGTATASATARQQQNATDSGAAAGAMVPGATTTVSAGPPVTVTTTPTPPNGAPPPNGAEEDIP